MSTPYFINGTSLINATSVAHDSGSGSCRIAFGFARCGNPDPGVTMSYAGVSMTKLATVTVTASVIINVFYLLNPTAGSNTSIVYQMMADVPGTGAAQTLAWNHTFGENWGWVGISLNPPVPFGSPVGITPFMTH